MSLQITHESFVARDAELATRVRQSLVVRLRGAARRITSSVQG
ncbi:MAG: hypothetical protein U0939_18320 [Pirellulales bacterium]